jgi:hypothetical protein
MVRTSTRYDVWTDAGRDEGAPLYLLIDGAAPTEAFALQRSLKARGWKAELRSLPILEAEQRRPSYRGSTPSP